MKPRPFALFYILFIYILLQLIWWAYLLYQLNVELHALRLDEDSAASFPLSRRLLMIFGEAVVFLTFLVLGFLFIHRSLKKEIELSRRRKNFMMAVAHELRTPLAGIRLQLETLLRHNLPEEKVKEITTRALQDSDRLEMLTDNMLLSYRIEDHSFVLQKSLLKAREEIENILRQLPVSSGVRELFKVEIPDEVMICADLSALNSILANLIENALKYAGQQPLTIRAAENQASTVLEVADQGPGVPAPEKEKIFSRFYRSGSEGTRTTKGTGLGLYIVQSLADMHGGQAFVKDNHPKGAIFTVTFPKAK